MRSLNICTSFLHKQPDSSSCEGSAFMAIQCRRIHWSVLRSSSKQRDNFCTILTKLRFTKRFSRKSLIYSFNEIDEMGAKLTKRQANKYKETNRRSSRLYKSISSVLIHKIKFPTALLIVGYFYLQCLQIGYRQIITTLNTLHAITIIHRHCVERGTTL